MSRTPRPVLSHLLAAGIGAAASALVLFWVRGSSSEPVTDDAPLELEVVETRMEPASTVALEPELDAIPSRTEEQVTPASAGATSSDDLAAFEKTLFPKEHEIMARWGADLASYREYKKAALENEGYLDGSLAFFLFAHCQSATPEKVFARLIQPHVRESIDASTKESVDQELQQFFTEFNRRRQLLKQRYDVDLSKKQPDSIAERTDYEKRYLAMWREMDEVVSSITCERQLQALLGPPSNRSAYLPFRASR